MIQSLSIHSFIFLFYGYFIYDSSRVENWIERDLSTYNSRIPYLINNHVIKNTHVTNY